MINAEQKIGFIKRLRDILISIMYLICLRLKYLLILCTGRKVVYGTILVYHAVSDDMVERFKYQMNILKQFTTPISIDYDGPFERKAHYSIITFDDAFKSVIKNAVPELTKLNIPFTVFIPAGGLGEYPGWLKNSGDKDEFETIASVDELMSIPSDIVTFGSHTINHNNLKQLDYEKACVEIRDSKIVLESLFEKEIKYFAFPNGAYNTNLIACCVESGYMQIFLIAPESPLAPMKKYVKGRVIVRPSDWDIEFTLKILGGYGWRSLTKSIKEGLKGSKTTNH